MMMMLKAAAYFPAETLPRENWKHFALNFPIYTHFTSPIRRYPDLLVHRLLTHMIEGKSEEDIADEFDSTQMKRVCKIANEKKKTGRTVSKAADFIFYMIILRADPVETEVLVTRVHDRKITVFIDELFDRKDIFLDRQFDMRSLSLEEKKEILAEERGEVYVKNTSQDDDEEGNSEEDSSGDSSYEKKEKDEGHVSEAKDDKDGKEAQIETKGEAEVEEDIKGEKYQIENENWVEIKKLGSKKNKDEKSNKCLPLVIRPYQLIKVILSGTTKYPIDIQVDIKLEPNPNYDPNEKNKKKDKKKNE